MPIRVTVNDESLNLPDGCTIGQLLEHMDLGERRVAVEHNGEIVPRSAHARSTLAEGDTVLVVHAIGGG